MQVVERDRPFYRASGGGVTISGGEPLLQSGFVAELLQACQSHELHTALETCGHATWENLACVLDHTDTVLFDVKHLDSVIHRRATGVGNELILGNLERAAACGAQIVLRLPLIPGFNADPVMVRGVADLAGRLAIRELHLLPYHRLGESKCEALGRATAPHIPFSLPWDEVERLRDIAAVVPGVRVQIGG